MSDLDQSGLRRGAIRSTPRPRERTEAHDVRKQVTDVQDACALAQAIVNTVREPLIVLDQDLRVVAASRSFYLKFKVDPDNTEGKLLYELGAGDLRPNVYFLTPILLNV